MRLIFIFFLLLNSLLINSSCSNLISSTDYEKIADAVTADTALKLNSQRELFLIGTGGRMMYDVEMMAMSFNYYQEVDIKTSRDLLSSCINEYLSAINSNEKLKPYLHNYPFTPKNIQIRIFLRNSDRTEIPPEKIYFISSIDGKFEYYLNSDHYHPICQETYEEAIRLNEEFLAQTDKSSSLSQ